MITFLIMIIYINFKLDFNGIVEDYGLQNYFLYIKTENNVIHINLTQEKSQP